MAKRSKFQAPRVLSDFTAVVRAFREVQESLDAVSQGRAQLRMNLRSFNLVAGNFQRASAPAAGMQARLPKASGENLGDAVTLHLEGMLGVLDVFAAPGDTVNGAASATYDADGMVVLWSNGVDSWSSLAQLPSPSPGVPAPSATLDGLSVLGRAPNSTGVMAAITATSARQVLRNNDAGTALEWEFPIEAQLDGVDLGNVHTINREDGRFTVAAGVATFDAPTTVSDTQTGTLNAYVLPATLQHGDTLTIVCSSDVVLNGIVAKPPGFGFYLNVSGIATRILTINDESASASALNRLSLAADLAFRNPPGASFWVSYASNRWLVVERAITEVQDDGVSQGFARSINALSTTSVTATATIAAGVASVSYQRAALTGFVAASANSNVTTSTEPLLTYSASSNMNNERVATTSTTVAVDLGTAAQARWNVVTSAAYTWTGGHSHTAGNWTFNSVGDFSVTGAVVGLVSSSTVLIDGVGTVTLESDANVQVNADALYLAGDGFLLLDAAAASTPSLTANQGLFWAFDPGAPATLPKFTDDANVDHELVSFDSLPQSSGNGSLGNTVTFFRDVTAGTAGTAGDTVFFSANAPFPMIIIASGLRLTTGSGAGDTMTLRDATGGGGNALSSAMSTVTAGDVVYSAGFAGAIAIPLNGTVVARWTDRAAVGTFWFTAVRTG